MTGSFPPPFNPNRLRPYTVRMTDAPGTYALVLRADRHHAIVVGRLGTMTVRPGFSV